MLGRGKRTEQSPCREIARIGYPIEVEVVGIRRL